MKLEGLTVNFLGDSITAGNGTSANERIFHQIIKEKYKLSYADKKAIENYQKQDSED